MLFCAVQGSLYKLAFRGVGAPEVSVACMDMHGRDCFNSVLRSVLSVEYFVVFSVCHCFARAQRKSRKKACFPF